MAMAMAELGHFVSSLGQLPNTDGMASVLLIAM